MKLPTIHGVMGACIVLAQLGACSSVPHDLPTRTASTPVVSMPIDPPGAIVGIAFSGGGSRAATFSAAVLHELAALNVAPAGPPKSLLEKTEYMSSVSGGSLAAAYYVVNKPGAAVSMMDGEHLSADYEKFFKGAFLSSMMSNWEGPLFGAAIEDAIPRADAVAGRWDEKLFHHATFADLVQREQAGDAPWLVMNGTSWDTGRRFAFTGLPANAFEYDFLGTVRAYIGRQHQPNDDLASIDQRFAPEKLRFAPMTFEEVNVDPSALSISLAVASSSSVPLLLGPVTFLVHGRDGSAQLLHIGDGGMFDNQGIESLAQVVFPKLLPAGRGAIGARHGLLVVIDASYPFNGSSSFYGHDDDLGLMLEKSPARISDIMEQRATAYQLMLWASLRSTQTQSDQIVPDFNHLTIVYLRHTDAYRELAVNPPSECTLWARPGMPPDEMLTHLSQIPTRFKLVSACDAALLQKSAALVVAGSKERLLSAFTRR